MPQHPDGRVAHALAAVVVGLFGDLGGQAVRGCKTILARERALSTGIKNFF